jgi:hypothetical protein
MDKVESTEEISEDNLTDEEFSDVKFEDL